MIQKRPALFYGWWIVGACFLINVLVTGTLYFGFTAFFEPIARDFGWTYAQVSLATSFRGMETGILAPVAGLAVDRYGPRKLVFVGAILMGLGVILFGRVNTLGMFYAAFILMSLGMSACSSVVLMAAISHWFRRKLSTAIGIAACGIATGGLMISLSTLFIDTFGWRTAIISLGLGVSGLTLCLSLLLRHKPEQYGYLPDGAVEALPIAHRAIDTARLPDSRPNLGIGQVLSDRTFWRIVVVFMLCFLAVTPVITHIMPYLSSVGISRATSGLLASAVPMATIFGRLGFGWLGDRFNKRRLTSVTIIAISLGLVLFGFMAPYRLWLALPFITLFSLGYGGNAIMMPVLVREYFGSAGFGATLGFVMGISAIGQILGSPLAGWVFDTQGSYLFAWLGSAIVLVIALILMATTPPATAGARLAVITKRDISR